MPLRTRIFLLLGGVLAVLVLAEWLLVRTLARDLAAEAGNVAMNVGESVFGLFGLEEGEVSEDVLVRDRAAWVGQPAGGASSPGAAADDPAALRVGGGQPLDAHVLAALRELARPREGSPPRPAELLSTGVVVLRGDAALRALGSDPPSREARTVQHGALMRFEMSVDSNHAPHFLELTGPDGQRRIPIPRAGIEAALDTFRRRLLLGTLGLLAAGIVATALVAHRISRPLRSLAEAAREVGEGELGTEVTAPASGEVGEAITAFNRMSRRLAELDADTKALREREHLGEIGEIARGLAHGLRSPLHALGLSVDELGEAGGDAAARSELVLSARRQLRRVDGALRSLLALGATGQDGAPSAPVDVAGLIEDVVLEALQDARGRVRLDAVAAEDLPLIAGGAAELRAALQALVVNAVEASPNGARVVVTARPREDGGVRVEVDDEGPGLPADVTAHLFTPHVTTKPHGTGMGLFLAHRLIVERHGGQLQLQPREGGGTRAVVDLPGGGAIHG